MLDTASIQALEAVVPVVAKSDIPRRSLEQIKAALAKARTQTHGKRIKEIQEQLLEFEDTIRMSKMREDSIATQIKSFNTELSDHLATLDEVRAFSEMLKNAGEDPVEIERATVLLVNEIKDKIAKCGENTKAIEKEKAEIGRRCSALREELAKLESGAPAAKTPIEIHRQETARQRDERNERQQNEKLARCRPEIKRIFDDVGRLPTKLIGLPGDKHKPARTLFVQHLAAEIRNMQQALALVLCDDEQITLRSSLYALCGISRRFDLFYIDGLNTRSHLPRDFSTWKDYLEDVIKQKERFFAPLPEDPKPLLYGVVKPAEPAVMVPSPESIPAPPGASLTSPAPIPETNIVADILAAAVEEIEELDEADLPAPKPVAQSKPVEKPKKKLKESPQKITDKILIRMIKMTKILKCTRGLRAAIFANGKAMDENLREFLEEAFEFKRLVWNDGKDNNIQISLKAKTIDVVFAHNEFYRLIGMAKKAKIPVAPVSAHSKQLLCQQICEFYNEKLDLNLLA